MKSVADQFATDAHPIVEALAPIVESGEEVWLPTVDTRDGTDFSVLNQYRDVARLLMMEFASAFHDGENDRAIFALQTNQKLFALSGQPRPFVAEMVREACAASGVRLITQSLQYDQWSDEELDQIESLLLSEATRKEIWEKANRGEAEWVWKNLIVNGTLFSGEGGAASQMFSRLSASEKLALVQTYHAIQSPRDTIGSTDFCKSIGALEESVQSSVFSCDRWFNFPLMQNMGDVGLLFPGVRSMGKQIAQHQASIRLAKLSLAARRYRRTNQRWPTSLDQLTGIGLPGSETLDPMGNPMLMQVTEEGCLEINFQKYLFVDGVPRFTHIVPVLLRPTDFA